MHSRITVKWMAIPRKARTKMEEKHGSRPKTNVKEHGDRKPSFRHKDDHLHQALMQLGCMLYCGSRPLCFQVFIKKIFFSVSNFIQANHFFPFWHTAFLSVRGAWQNPTWTYVLSTWTYTLDLIIVKKSHPGNKGFFFFIYGVYTSNTLKSSPTLTNLHDTLSPLRLVVAVSNQLSLSALPMLNM